MRTPFLIASTSTAQEPKKLDERKEGRRGLRLASAEALEKHWSMPPPFVQSALLCTMLADARHIDPPFTRAFECTVVSPS